MITLQKITSKNIEYIQGLKADEKFVATNTDSLAEAYAYYVEFGFGPLAYGIYHNDEPVGFIMVDYQKDDEKINDKKPYYFLWRMMLDEKQQNKGYGRAALELMMQEVRTFPLGEADKIFTSVEPSNTVATKFYESFGFVKNGQINYGEEVMELVL